VNTLRRGDGGGGDDDDDDKNNSVCNIQLRHRAGAGSLAIKTPHKILA
jgi:hypothetical protein